jgi:hypothetical protein
MATIILHPMQVPGTHDMGLAGDTAWLVHAHGLNFPESLVWVDQEQVGRLQCRLQARRRHPKLDELKNYATPLTVARAIEFTSSMASCTWQKSSTNIRFFERVVYTDRVSH